MHASTCSVKFYSNVANFDVVVWLGCAVVCGNGRGKKRKKKEGDSFSGRVKNENVSCEHVGYHW